MALDPFPDFTKIGRNLQEGGAALISAWPFLCLVFSGMAFAVTLAMSMTPAARHAVIGWPVLIFTFDPRFVWIGIGVLLVIASAGGIVSRTRRRIDAGVSNAVPQLAELECCKDFLSLVGSLRLLGPKWLEDLEMLARQIPDPALMSTPRLVEFSKMIKIFRTYEGTKVAFSTGHAKAAECWIKDIKRTG